METAAGNSAPSERHFEDYPVGAVFELGTITVDAAQVVAFAERYDPQPFHTDPRAAAASMYEGLIASGWHTASLVMRLIADGYLSHGTSLGSPGVDELHWLRPVRPGDRLSARASVLEANRSRSKPDRGMVRSLIEVLNQDAELVMTMKAMNLVRCRAAG